MTPRRGAYARLVARARRGDAAAFPLVGIIAAAVIYLMLFGALLNVTKDQEDTSRVENRMLSDRAATSLHLLLNTPGEGLNVTVNPDLAGTPDRWDIEPGASVIHAEKDGRQAVQVTRATSGLALTSERSPVRPGASYVLKALLHSASTVDVVWYNDDDVDAGVVRRDVAAVVASAASWTTLTSAALTTPASATHVELEVSGAAFWAGRISLETPVTRAWERSPDGLIRFGLVEEDLASHPGFSSSRLPSVLDYQKMGALRRGELVSRANGAADYPDVRASLGLGEFNFHLRAHPMIPKLGPLFGIDQGIRMAYVGNYEETDPTPGRVDIGAPVYTPPIGTPQYIDFPITVHNDGNEAMPFRVTTKLDLPAPGGRIVTDTLNTGEIPGMSSATVTYRVYGMGAANDWKLGTNLHVQLINAHSRLDDTENRAFTKPGLNGNAYNLKIEPGSPYFLPGSSPRIWFDYFDNKGQRPDDDEPELEVEILDSAGTRVYYNAEVELDDDGPESIRCGACSSAGLYTVRARDLEAPLAQQRWYEEKFTVLAGAPESATVETAASAVESDVLTELVAAYTDGIARTASECPGSDPAAGDKYRDLLTDAERLAAALLRDSDHTLCYHLLIVGSGAQHTAMNSPSVQYEVGRWVAAGGTLVLLGSAAQSADWLQPLGSPSLVAAGGGVGAPDPTHPLINSPEQLAYHQYNPPATAWELDSGPAAHYTHILVRDSDPSTSTDLLAISRPGVFGDGTVILAAHQPFDLLPGSGPEEGEETKRFLHNMVVQGYAPLYIDYGPPVPAGAPAASDSRLAVVPHPLAPGQMLEMWVTLYVFR